MVSQQVACALTFEAFDDLAKSAAWWLSLADMGDTPGGVSHDFWRLQLSWRSLNRQKATTDCNVDLEEFIALSLSTACILCQTQDLEDHMGQNLTLKEGLEQWYMVYMTGWFRRHQAEEGMSI